MNKKVFVSLLVAIAGMGLGNASQERPNSVRDTQDQLSATVGSNVPLKKIKREFR